MKTEVFHDDRGQRLVVLEEDLDVIHGRFQVWRRDQIGPMVERGGAPTVEEPVVQELEQV